MIRRIAVVILVTVTFSMIVADVALIALPRVTAVPDVYGMRGIGAILGILLATLGTAIALRQPQNRVGWVFLVSGVFTALLEVAGEYARYALVELGGVLPGGAWAVVLTGVGLSLGIGPITTYLLLIFPDGRLPSARWRPVEWYTVTILVVWAIAPALLFAEAGFGLVVRNPSPIGLAITLDERGRQLLGVMFAIPAAILCGAAFVHRFRRSRGVERQQLKWVAYAAVVMVASGVLLPVVFGRKPLEIAQQLTTLLVPLAAGLAILRYRLYDIDVLINRTLVYGSLTAVLGLVYVVTVLLSQQMLRGFTGGSDIAVAGSTLLVVALFQPIRARVQRLVDRRFYRARYDATRTIDAFAGRLRGDVDLDSVRADLIGVVHDTIHPAHASVWLRSAKR
jgi:hypothetical protein